MRNASGVALRVVVWGVVLAVLLGGDVLALQKPGKKSKTPPAEAKKAGAEKPAAEDSSGYEDLWQQVANLLADRAYGAARAILEEARGDAQLAQFRGALAADVADAERLLQLEARMDRGVRGLQPGQPLKLAGTEYRVVRVEVDADEPRLVLKLPAGTGEIVRKLADLNPQDWLALAEPPLGDGDEDRAVAALYHATVAHGDRKLARQALSRAAGASPELVGRWTTRLDNEAARLKAEEAAKDDPIQGNWRLVLKFKRDVLLNVEFRRGGKSNLSTVTWRKVRDGRYKITLPGGATADVELGPRGEVLKGHTANGSEVRGLRQAKTKK